MFDAIEAGPEAAEELVRQWESEVRAHVPEDKLLVFDVRDGWEPLCKFLGVPVPEGQDFPRYTEL